MQSILRNYLAWIIMTVLLVVFLVIQFVWVDSRRKAVMKANDAPVNTLKAATAMQRDSDRMPTRGDVNAALAKQKVIRGQHNDIRKDLRSYTDGLNRYMSNGRNPNGEIMDPRTGVEDPAAPGRTVDHQFIDWSVFAPTVNQIYAEMLDGVRQNVLNRRLEPTRRALTDRYYAGDGMTTPEGAAERAEKEAPLLNEQSVGALFEGGIAGFNRVTNINEVYKAGVKADRERGWRVWREFLIDSDILGRVLPEVAVELDVEYWAKTPLNEDDRRQYVAARLADSLAPEQIHRESVPWKRKATRFVDRITRVEVVDFVLGQVEMPAENDPNLLPADFEKPIPEGRVYDRYRLRIGITAHPAVVTDFLRKLMAAQSGMLYVPVRTELKKLPDNLVLNLNAAAAGQTPDFAALRGMTARYEQAAPQRSSRRVAGGSRRQTSADAAGRAAAALRVSVGYDYEPPVNAVILVDLYRFRYSNTDNEEPPRTVTRDDEFDFR